MITIASDPEAHVSLLTGFTVDTPSLLFSFYLSPPLTFFSPLFYSVVYPVFPSLCYFLLSLSRAVVSCDCLCSTGGGVTPLLLSLSTTFVQGRTQCENPSARGRCLI